MKEGDRVGPYIATRPLGKGSGGATWLAVPTDKAGAKAEIVVKVLDIGEAVGWGGVDLLRREAAALGELSHPGIPRFLGSFEDTSGGHVRLVLAMERVEGSDLEALVGGGRRFSEAEIQAILAQLADILAYLGSLRPPVVHRDVNPRNVMLRPDLSVALVDFSCAQDSLRRGAAGPGATLVGTAGYIPVEQVAGKAVHRSDLYAAASTALFLLTRANPAELPLKSLKPELSSLGELAPALAYVLDNWLEADETKRSLGAREAARVLRGESPVPCPPPVPARSASRADQDQYLIDIDGEDGHSPPRRANEGLPSDSRIRIVEKEGGLTISIPPAGLANPVTLGIGGFAVFWLGFVVFWTLMAVTMGAPIFFVLFSIPFWAIGIGMVKGVLSTAFGRVEIVLDRENGLAWNDRLFMRSRLKRWPLSDLGSCSIADAVFKAKGSDAKELLLEAGTARLRLGRGLTERELRAIAAKIETWLDEARGS